MVIFKVLQMFQVYDDIVEMERYGRGFINRTYYVKGNNKNYILLVMDCAHFENTDNIIKNTTLLVDQLVENYPDSYRFHDLETKEGERFIKIQNNIWHGFSIPKNLRLFKKVIDTQMMSEIGQAIGLFHKSLMGLAIDDFSFVVSDYNRSQKLDHALTKTVKLDTFNRSMMAFNEVKFLKERIKEMNGLYSLTIEKKLPIYIIYNNIRLNNILFDEETYRFASVIGYDVVGPGTILYDLGDTIKHLAVTTREDEANLDLVQINTNYFAAFIQGYFMQMAPHLIDLELDNIVEATRVLALEEALRYTIDFLENDRVYKVDYRLQNLERARNRIQLVRDIESKRAILTKIIDDIKNEKN